MNRKNIRLSDKTRRRADGEIAIRGYFIQERQKNRHENREFLITYQFVLFYFHKLVPSSFDTVKSKLLTILR